MGKKKKEADSIAGIRELKELLKPGDLVMYDLSYDDMFDVHQREAMHREVGMVLAVLTRTVRVRWQRSGICNTYSRSALTVLSRRQE